MKDSFRACLSSQVVGVYRWSQPKVKSLGPVPGLANHQQVMPIVACWKPKSMQDTI